MPIIIKALGGGRIGIYDPDKEAKVGRWCRPPLVPDRCDRCFDPETLAHYETEGYREEVDPGGKVWRYGTCHRCRERR
jgi:hypothetical protein